jgi:hypothetical protein
VLVKLGGVFITSIRTGQFEFVEFFERHSISAAIYLLLFLFIDLCTVLSPHPFLLSIEEMRLISAIK